MLLLLSKQGALVTDVHTDTHVLGSVSGSHSGEFCWFGDLRAIYEPVFLSTEPSILGGLIFLECLLLILAPLNRI